jgi:vacuolar-type H+-ATPase subunit F/Vma7
MTNALAFVGDPLSAAAFRLAGCSVFAPQAGREADAVRAALASAQAVFITREVAARLPVALLDVALAASSPLLTIIPDGAPNERGPAERVARQLGLES